MNKINITFDKGKTSVIGDCTPENIHDAICVLIQSQIDILCEDDSQPDKLDILAGMLLILHRDALEYLMSKGD